MSTHSRTVNSTWPYSVLNAAAVPPAGYHTDPAYCVAKMTSLIDCLRKMIEIVRNPHNIPMEKQLHGRRLTLKGEPGRIALHGYMY